MVDNTRLKIFKPSTFDAPKVELRLVADIVIKSMPGYVILVQGSYSKLLVNALYGNCFIQIILMHFISKVFITQHLFGRDQVNVSIWSFSQYKNIC